MEGESAESEKYDAVRIDRAMALLDSAQRRHVLASLGNRRDPPSLEELARLVDSWDLTADGAPVSRIALCLHHVHLPKLDAAGVIDYDATDKRVTAWRHPDLGGRWVGGAPTMELAAALASSMTAPSSR